MAGVTSGAVPGPRWSDGSAMDPSFILGMTLQRPSTSLIYRHKTGPRRDTISFVLRADNCRGSRLDLARLRIIGQECETAIVSRLISGDPLNSSLSIKRDGIARETSRSINISRDEKSLPRENLRRAVPRAFYSPDLISKESECRQRWRTGRTLLNDRAPRRRS